MRLLKKSDFYSLKTRGYVTLLHLQVLNVLYLPLLGAKATLLYSLLHSMRDFRKGEPVAITNLSEKLELSLDQLSMTFSRLEALGLIRSFYEKHKEFNEYTIELFAPKDPASFSKDEIYMHLLISKVGPRTAQDLVNLFRLDQETTGKSETTSEFGEVFGDEFNRQPSKHDLINYTLDNNVGHISFNFNSALFLNIIVSEKLFKVNAFSNEELKSIENLAGLYNVDERVMAEKVVDFYDENKPQGARVDFEAMKNLLSEMIKYPELRKTIKRRTSKKLKGEGEKIALINKMEESGPLDFLAFLNNGVKIAPADMRLVETLSLDYFLPPAVINALIYFTLTNYNNELPRSLVEKLASSLSRKKILTALDALDALERPARKKSLSISATKDESVEVVPNKAEEDPLDEEILKILKDY